MIETTKAPIQADVLAGPVLIVADNKKLLYESVFSHLLKMAARNLCPSGKLLFLPHFLSSIKNLTFKPKHYRPAYFCQAIESKPNHNSLFLLKVLPNYAFPFCVFNKLPTG